MQGARRDSVKNGAAIGAVLGGVALGGFVYYLCNALDDTGGDAECLGGTLVWTGIGAAGGALFGAGVDALFAHPAIVRPAQPGKLRRAAIPSPALRLRVRF